MREPMVLVLSVNICFNWYELKRSIVLYVAPYAVYICTYVLNAVWYFVTLYIIQPLITAISSIKNKLDYLILLNLKVKKFKTRIGKKSLAEVVLIISRK